MKFLFPSLMAQDQNQNSFQLLDHQLIHKSRYANDQLNNEDNLSIR